MCGIRSCFRAQDIETLRKYFESISARGPDCSELSTLCGGAVTLGFHRLAIISLGERGNQPWRYGEGGRHSFVCSGEIYNWKEICGEIGIDDTDLRSDMDVITKLLELTPDDPAQALSRLDGDWAFISVDEKTRTVTAGRDPLGVRPLFYGMSETGEVVAMSSEVKGLVGMPGVAETRVFPPGTWWRSDVPDRFDSYTDIYPAGRRNRTCHLGRLRER